MFYILETTIKKGFFSWLSYYFFWHRALNFTYGINVLIKSLFDNFSKKKQTNKQTIYVECSKCSWIDIRFQEKYWRFIFWYKTLNVTYVKYHKLFLDTYLNFETLINYRNKFYSEYAVENLKKFLAKLEFQLKKVTAASMFISIMKVWI